MAGFGAALGLRGKGGRVTATGIIYNAPPAWTCQHTATGTYVITHNLNLNPQTYVVMVCGAADPTQGPDPPNLCVFVYDESPNSFTVWIGTGPPGSPAGSPANAVDWSFNFLLCLM